MTSHVHMAHLDMNTRVDEETSEEDILRAIRNSLKDLQTPRQPMSRIMRTAPNHQSRGLSAVADVVHKEPRPTWEEDLKLAELTYEQQLELAMKESELDGMDTEEQIRRAIEESKKSLAKPPTPPPSNDEDMIALAIKLSMDPNQQENPEYRDHFQHLTSSEASGSRTAAAVPKFPTERIFSVDELEEVRLAPKPPPASMSSKLAAKFGPKEEFFNEDLFNSQLKLALDASLLEMKMNEAVGFQPKTSSSTSQYAKVAAKKASVSPPQRPSPSPVAHNNGYRALPSTRKKRSRGSFRPVVIDGCNVAFQHGRNQTFSAKGLLICYEYFKKMGYDDSDIIIIVKHVPKLLQEDIDLMEQLKQIGVLHECPSRFAGSELIRSDDDLMILDVAKQNEGIVVSRDRFQDNWSKMITYRDVIKNRLVQPTFIGDLLTLPQDPLGKNGPTLHQFLRFDS